VTVAGTRRAIPHFVAVRDILAGANKLNNTVYLAILAVFWDEA
jgi:hypothetical protein